MTKKYILIISMFFLGVTSLAAQCMEDCVWPGDANANGIANHLDLLYLGLTWEATGPVRDNPSVDWAAKEATDWADNLPVSGLNFKHSDANGDGQVFYPDIEIIHDNFSQTNENFTGLLGNNFEGDDLRAIPSQTDLTLGTEFEVDLQLGTEENPIEGIYGIGFTMSLTNEYAGVLDFDFSNSWLAEDTEELLNFGKFPPDSNQVYIALTRRDRTPISGFGHIGTVKIVIVDIIDALDLDSTACLPMDIRIKNIFAINEMEEELLISGNANKLNIKHSSQITAIDEPRRTPKIDLFPNPVRDVLTIRWAQEQMQQIRLFDARGELVRQQSLAFYETAYQMSTKDLSAGIYWLEVQGEKGIFTQKIIVVT